MASNKTTVLVVDDDPLEGELLVRALRKSGVDYPVQVLTRAEEAKRYLRGDGDYSDRDRFPIPNLVILDHRMPGDTGWDVLEWMRQETSLKSLPAIVFSGSGTAADATRASELGAAYQVKPHDSEKYEAVVKRMAEFWLWWPRVH